MEQGEREARSDAGRFGRFLRKVREARRLSLDAVEEMSSAFPERLTKSHLSRIENGLAEPSFRKLFALSQIYGMPLVTLAERYELDLKRELTPVDVAGKSEEEIDEQTVKLMQTGRHAEALALLTAVLDKLSHTTGSSAAGETAYWKRQFRLELINCLVRLGRYESAKTETEDLLGDADLTLSQRLVALQLFVNSCYSLGRFTVAIMGLDHAEKTMRSAEAPRRMAADLLMLRGNVLSVTGELAEAVKNYGRALEMYRELGNAFEECRTRINLSSALIELNDLDGAREQLEAALIVSEASTYDRLTAMARSNMALLAFRRGDHDASEAWAIRSNSLARPREFVSLVFRNCYYLLEIAKARGDVGGVRANERTLTSLLGKVEDYLPEVEAFRALLAGGRS